MGIKISKTHPVTGRTYSVTLKEVCYTLPDGSAEISVLYDPTEETEEEVMAKIIMQAKNSVVKNVKININTERSYAKTETYYNPAHLVSYRVGVYGPNLKTVDPDTGESLEISSGVYGETVKRRNPKTKAYSKEKPGVYGVKKIIYDPVTGMETTHSPGVYGVKVSHRRISAPKPSLATAAEVSKPRITQVTPPAVEQDPVPSPPPVAFAPPPVVTKAHTDPQASQANYQAVPSLAEAWLLVKLQGGLTERFDDTLMLKRLRNGEHQIPHYACDDRLAWAQEHIDWILLGLHDDAFWAPIQGQPFQEWSRLLALSSEPLNFSDAPLVLPRMPQSFKQRLTMPLRVLKRSIKIDAFWADRIFGLLVLLPILLLVGIKVMLIGSLLGWIFGGVLLVSSCVHTYLEIMRPIPWLQPLRKAQTKYQQVVTEIVLEDSRREFRREDITLSYPEDSEISKSVSAEEIFEERASHGKR